MSALAPSVTHRDPKGRKFFSVAETAYDKAGLSEDEAQRVNDTPGLADLIASFIADNRLTDKFKNEEVKSSYGYLSGYKPKSVADQVKILRKHFPNLNYDVADVAVPQGAEGLFATPRWQLLGSTYNEAFQVVLAKLIKVYGDRFYNYRPNEMGPENLRESARKVAFMEQLAKAQGKDILLVPAQFGIRHRGRSVRRAREVFTANEFGLGAYEVAIMLLTHPERLQHYDDLWIDLAGDEFKPSDEREFSLAPCFDFHGGKLKFGAAAVDPADGLYGSASAFLPQ